MPSQWQLQTNSPTIVTNPMLASNKKGDILYLTQEGGVVYKSTDYGATWSIVNSNTYGWYGVACDYTGQKIVINSNGRGIFTSTNGGTTWNGPAKNGNGLIGCASSGDGNILVSMNPGGPSFYSTNGGTTWNESTNARDSNLWAATANATGSILACCARGGSVYTSTNYGATWNSVTDSRLTSGAWVSIACDATGQKLIVCGTFGNYVYLSTNAGSTWTQPATLASLGGQNWTCVTSDSTGTNLAACYSSDSGGYIYLSSDSGSSWNQQTPTPGPNNWGSRNNGGGMASNFSGSVISAYVANGKMWSYSNVLPGINVSTSSPPYNAQFPGYTDLSYIFQPYTTGATAPPTNILVNGTDLSSIFAPYTTGATAAATNIKTNGTDLSEIFAPI